jgi:hypothetical protein
MKKSTSLRVNRADLDRLMLIGAQMANVYFNYGQRKTNETGYIIDQRNIAMMYDLSKQWDEARRHIKNPEAAKGTVRR